MPSFKERLKQILIHKGLVTPEQMAEVLKYQKERGCGLSAALSATGALSEKDLIAVIGRELQVPVIDLSKLKLDAKAAQYISEDFVRLHNVVPISKVGNSLTIAMSDPLNILALDDILSATKFVPIPVIATETDIRNAIDHIYSVSANEEIEKIVEDIKGADIEVIETPGKEEPVFVETDISKEPVVRFTEEILENGIMKRCSDIFVEPLDEEMRVRFRIDGVIREYKRAPKSMHDSVISRFKVMGELDIAERRVPQDGRFKVRFNNREVDCRLSILPTIKGEKAVIRLLDKTVATLDIEKLGFKKRDVEALKKCASHPNGMMLVVGPTGSGKTTTLYSVLKYVNSPEVNIVTVEDPVEYQIEGINQSAMNLDIGYTFAKALRSILRQDPEIIMVGEIRDFETVDIAIKAALTGHLVLSTLHTNTAAATVVRLINMGIDSFLINATLICIVAQRLIRKLCPHCREAYTPRAGIIKKLNIKGIKEPSKAVFYHPKGCDKCVDTGYSGRVGISEMLVISPAIKKVIKEKPQETEIKRIARKEGMTTLREAALVHVVNGITSIEEALRTTMSDDGGDDI